MLTLILAIKAVTEIALLALLAQGVLGVLIGGGRLHNPVYRLLQVLSQPLVRMARWLSPRPVQDRHVPLVAFILLMWVWLGATLAKVWICLQAGVNSCR